MRVLAGSNPPGRIRRATAAPSTPPRSKSCVVKIWGASWELKACACRTLELTRCSKPRTCAFPDFGECTGTWFEAATMLENTAGTWFEAALAVRRRHFLSLVRGVFAFFTSIALRCHFPL